MDTNGRSKALKLAIRNAGGISELARQLGIKRQAVSAWRKVPVARCWDVAHLTGIPEQELRPDVFRK